MKRFHNHVTHLDSLLEILKKPEYQEAGFCGILIRSPDKKHAALVRSAHEDIYSALQQYTSITKMGLSWKKGWSTLETHNLDLCLTQDCDCFQQVQQVGLLPDNACAFPHTWYTWNSFMCEQGYPLLYQLYSRLTKEQMQKSYVAGIYLRHPLQPVRGYLCYSLDHPTELLLISKSDSKLQNSLYNVTDIHSLWGGVAAVQLSVYGTGCGVEDPDPARLWCTWHDFFIPDKISKVTTLIYNLLNVDTSAEMVTKVAHAIFNVTGTLTQEQVDLLVKVYLDRL